MIGKAVARGNRRTPLAKRYDPAAACAKKVRYASWEDAEKVCRIHAQRDRKMVFAHYCDYCDGWHNAKPLSAMWASVNDPVRRELMEALR